LKTNNIKHYLDNKTIELFENKYFYFQGYNRKTIITIQTNGWSEQFGILENSIMIIFSLVNYNLVVIQCFLNS